MNRSRSIAVALGAALLAACSGEGPAGPTAREASLAFLVMVPSYVNVVKIAVTGPGIDSALIFNATIDNGVASGTIRLPAGSDRRVVAAAFDLAGVNTHRGDTTITVLEQNNPPLSMVMQPLLGGLPLTLTIGANVVAVSGQDTTLALGYPFQFTATALDWRGQPAGYVNFASANPAIATVDGAGWVTPAAPGVTSVVASFEGAAARRLVTVAHDTAGWIYFGDNGLRRVRPDGTRMDVLRLGRAGWAEGAYPELSPDGRAVVFTATGPSVPGGTRNQIVIVPVDHSAETVAFDSIGCSQGLVGASWSPDGQKLVFAWRLPGCAAAELFLVNADGTGLTQLTGPDTLGRKHFPTWSPDGQRIAFNCHADTVDRDICVVGTDGSGLMNLTSAPGRESHPAWLANDRLVFSRDWSGNLDVYAMNLDGSGLVQLTSGPQNEYWPRPSRDRQRITFWGEDGQYVMGMNGQGRYRMPVQFSSWPAAAWGP